MEAPTNAVNPEINQFEALLGSRLTILVARAVIFS
jgi:hypothetical protein